MTSITKSHWIEFIIRSCIFILTLVGYLIDIISDMEIVKQISHWVIGIYFTYQMVSRLIPNKNHSMGNQKVFGRNYTQIENLKRGIIGYNKKNGNRVAFAVAIVWLLLNLNIFILYFCGVIDRDLLMVLAMVFSVCDLICVLFICPFQLLFMRNKCCTTCRIYNWDFAMMFTPLWVVPSVLNYLLVILSFVVLVHWEINHHKHPERFYEETNYNLRCLECKELMCKNRLRKVND